eukprot:6175178-Pleurochrysis_carterae.AAC.2
MAGRRSEDREGVTIRVDLRGGTCTQVAVVAGGKGAYELERADAAESPVGKRPHIMHRCCSCVVGPTQMAASVSTTNSW